MSATAPDPFAADDCLVPVFAEIKRALRLCGQLLPSALDDHEAVAEAAGRIVAALGQVEAAFTLAGVESLAALTALSQRLLICHPGEQPSFSAGCATALNQAFNTLQTAMAHWLLHGSLPLTRLLPTWTVLAACDRSGSAHPSALLSLQFDSATLLPLPVPTDAPRLHDPRAEFESALLCFLRSDVAAEREQAAGRIAHVIIHLIAVVSSQQPLPANHAGWRVLHAAASVIANGGVSDMALAKKILAATGRLVRQTEDERFIPVPPLLIRQALFAIARARSHTAASMQIVRAFNLDMQLPPEAFELSGSIDDSQAMDDLRVALQTLTEVPESSALPVFTAAALDPLITTLAKLPAFQPLAAAFSALETMLSLTAPGPDQVLSIAASVLTLQQLTDGIALPEDSEAMLSLVGEAVQTIGDPHEACASRRLHPVSLCMQMPCTLTALAAAITENLTGIERQIERLIEENPGAAEREMVLVTIDHRFAEIRAALQLLDEPVIIARLDNLLEPLGSLVIERANDRLVADPHQFAEQFVALSAIIAAMPRHHALNTTDLISHALVDVEPGNRHESRQALTEVSSGLRLIFLEEAAHRIQQLQFYLDAAIPDSAPLPDMAIHTAHALAGCSATVGLWPMRELALAIEACLNAIDSHGSTPAADARQVLQEAIVSLEKMLADWSAGVLPDRRTALCEQLLAPARAVSNLLSDINDTAAETSIPDAVTESSHTGALVGIAIEKTVADECVHDGHDAAASASINSTSAHDAAHNELHQIFIEEAADLLPQLDEQLRAWIANPTDNAAPVQMLRILHTLKGSARMAGEVVLGDALHQMEQHVGELARRSRPDSGSIRSLESTLDGLLQPFIADNAWASASLDPVQQPVQMTSEGSHAGVMTAVSESRQTAIQDDDANRALAARHIQDKSSPSLQLRVRADFLDRIGDIGAELLVGIARVTNEVQQQRQTISDLSDNLGRLRTQLRELEIHAESRIASAVAQTAVTEFDPLEFDRYTRLHELTRMMSESIADLASLQRTLSRQSDNASRVLVAQSQHARLLQSDLRRVRTLPFASLSGRLQHLLRQVARDRSCEMALTIDGGHIDIDRGVLDRLIGPLEHLVRNAVAHGIESADERQALGKPLVGHIRMNLSQQGNSLLLQMSDDGRGLDWARIRQRAIALGLLEATAEPDQSALSQLIFEPGFSTASEVTELSGRGIGMDAVRAAVIALGGQLSVTSQSGAGVCFMFNLPLTLATLQVVLVTAGSYEVALPATLVQQMMQLSPAGLAEARAACSIEWQGRRLPLHRLSHLMGDATDRGIAHRTPVAVLRQLDQYLAIELDAVAGHREVVVKNLGPQLARVPGLAGATVLGDGSVTLIINPMPLPEFVAANFTDRDSPVTTTGSARAAPLVFVVDDSLTVRRASQRMLERHGYRVVLARDGLDALEQLRLNPPGAILLDIEMPRMDGFEFLAALRDDARWKDLPVAMITSRNAQRHREHAMKLGANAYLGKPFVEEELLALLAQWLAPAEEGDTLSAA